MAARNEPIFEKGVIAHEGGTYTDGVHPCDPGGPTRWGITLIDYRLHFDPHGTAADVRVMPLAVALRIYLTKYWNNPSVRGDDLPCGLDYSAADYGVNSGVGRAGKVLRRLLSLSDHTSLVTAEVLAAVALRDPKALITAMNAERLRFLQSLPIWHTYKNGWTTRIREVLGLSLKLADVPASAPVAFGGDITPTTDSTTMAKGMIPPPTTAKKAVATATTTATTAGGAPFSDWVMAHPAESGIIAAIVLVLTAVVIKLIHDHHIAKQEAPTPGLVPVPVRA